MRMNFYNKRKAFSLVELLLVLGVLAVLLIAAFVVYPKVKMAQQVNSEVRNLSAVQASLRTMYAPTGYNYKALTLDAAKNGNVFPKVMLQSDGTVKNSWGGTIVLGPSVNPYSGLGANRTYVIRYRNVPAEACAAFVTQTAGYFVAIGIGTESKADGSYSKIVHVLTDAKSTGYNNGPTTGLLMDSLVTECNSRPESEIMFISE